MWRFLLLVNRMSGSIMNVMNVMTDASITSSTNMMVFNPGRKR